MTIGEIIQRVQSLYNAGVQSDQNRLTSAHVYNKIVSSRSRLLRQKVNKKQKVSQWNYQTIPCVALEPAPLHECACDPNTGIVTLRTVDKLPKPITELTDHIIESVTSVNGDIILSETSWVANKYKTANRYTGSKPDYYIRNEHLYITSRSTDIDTITITGLFENPIDVIEYPNCNNSTTSVNLVTHELHNFKISNTNTDDIIVISGFRYAGRNYTLSQEDFQFYSDNYPSNPLPQGAILFRQLGGTFRDRREIARDFNEFFNSVTNLTLPSYNLYKFDADNLGISIPNLQDDSYTANLDRLVNLQFTFINPNENRLVTDNERSTIALESYSPIGLVPLVEETLECVSYSDIDFPIDNDSVDTLIEMSLQEIVLFFAQNDQILENK